MIISQLTVVELARLIHAPEEFLSHHVKRGVCGRWCPDNVCDCSRKYGQMAASDIRELEEIFWKQRIAARLREKQLIDARLSEKHA